MSKISDFLVKVFTTISTYLVLIILLLTAFYIIFDSIDNGRKLYKIVYQLEHDRDRLTIENQKLLQKVQLLKDDVRHLQEKVNYLSLQQKKFEKSDSINFKNRYYYKLLEFEGSYSNDPYDLGSETVYGITRKYDSSHRLWNTVDELKEILQDESIYNTNTLKNKIEESDIIHRLVYNTYERKWKNYKLHQFPFELSSQLFDIIINCGEHNAIEMLQYTLNAFNYKHRFGEDLIIDGRFGKTTIDFLNKAIIEGYTSKIIASLVSLRIHHYLRISNSNMNQRKFINGWIKRASAVY